MVRVSISREEAAMSRAHLKVLLIDDNQDIRDLMRMMLEKTGLTVFEAEDGAKGLIKAREIKPDLILLDVMMPGLSGFQVLEQIREEKGSQLREVPILMITAKSQSEDVDRALSLGATGYIVKPFRQVKFIEKVNSLLGIEG